MLLHGEEPTLGMQHLPEGFALSEMPEEDEVGRDHEDAASREAEHRRLREALHTHRGNVSRAARAAHMSRAHAYKLMELFGMRRDDFRDG